jgi:glycosyltransferase involved in cell wall biosynthesis
MQASTALPAVVSKVLFRIPYLVTYGYDYVAISRMDHRSALNKFLKRLYLFFVTRLALGFATKVIVTNNDIFRKLSERWAKKLEHIPNGVSLNLFKFHGGQRRSNCFTIGFVGRLEPQKNIFSLLEAASLVAARHPTLSIQVELVGGGFLREQLGKRVSDLEIIKTTFHGVVEHQRIPEILKGCSCFVLPSQAEGHPKALLEAMAVGLPCIGADVPGIRTVLRHMCNGLLVGTDAQSIAAGLDTLIRDQELASRLGQNARTIIEQSYELDKLLTREVSLLKEVALPRG